MSTRRRRLLVATVAATVVAALPVLAALGTLRLTERPSAALPAITGLAPAVEPGPACVARGPAPLPDDAGPVVPPGSRVTAVAVLSCPAAFDGVTVTYVGEVVGDVLQRDGGAWVLVNDDPYALETGPLPAHGSLAGTNTGLPVWLPEELLAGLGEPGRPGRRGDVVELTGRVVRVDRDDAGGTTLRAESLRIVAAGEPVGEPLDVPRLVLALVLVGSALAVRVAHGRASDRGRSSVHRSAVRRPPG